MANLLFFCDIHKPITHMKKLVLMHVLTSAILYGWKKETAPTPIELPKKIDDRDIFKGSYRGIKVLEVDGKETFENIDAFIFKDHTYKLMFVGLYGIPNGNTFRTEQQSATLNINGNLVTIIVGTGTMALNGNSLTGIVPFTFVADNTQRNGTFTYILDKYN